MKGSRAKGSTEGLGSEVRDAMPEVHSPPGPIS